MNERLQEPTEAQWDVAQRRLRELTYVVMNAGALLIWKLALPHDPVDAAVMSWSRVLFSAATVCADLYALAAWLYPKLTALAAQKMGRRQNDDEKEALRRKIAELERKIEALEAQFAKTAVPQSVSAEPQTPQQEQPPAAKKPKPGRL